ncbi:MAG: 6,7-dimethyl-8-ribityllumazine synthase [Gammaproteobacteria bacterium]|nr:6,7-dimethyl-8-ribityllumazine synthase [Gammaproteobacteria bacterium]
MRKLTTYSGERTPHDLRVTIVASRFNPSIVDALIEGAARTLMRLGVRSRHIELVRVPGAFEIPAAVKKVIAARQPDAVIALGAVLRGETPHFEYICASCSQGLAQVALESSAPVAFGVLTVDTVEQAVARSGEDDANKGSEAAASAIEMVSLFRLLG